MTNISRWNPTEWPTWQLVAAVTTASIVSIGIHVVALAALIR